MALSKREIFGEREFQSQTTGRFAKDGGNYRPSVRNSSWSWCPSKISGSKWVALLPCTTFMVFQALRISGNWLGRVLPSICATDF